MHESQNDVIIPSRSDLERWQTLVARWSRRSVAPTEAEIARGIAAVLDDEGSPRSLAPVEWEALARAILDSGLPLDAEIARGLLFRLLQFTRPDGSAMFGPVGKRPGQGKSWRTWAAKINDPSLSTVIDRWFPSRSSTLETAGPAFPAEASADRALAMLRADWNSRGAWLAIDHRKAGPTTSFELAGSGQVWLGHDWTGGPDGKCGRPRRTYWSSSPYADCFEWSYRQGQARVTRLAVNLRGRSLALLAEQVDGPSGEEESLQLRLADGVTAKPVADSRLVALTKPGSKTAAWALPLGLPALPYETDRGRFEIVGRDLRLTQPATARRRFRVVLIGWDRPPKTWRTATAAEKSRNCPPDVAFAARIGWGLAEEGIIFYKSLGPKAERCFLGHQVRSRFLIGTFSGAGEVRQLLKVD